MSYDRIQFPYMICHGVDLWEVVPKRFIRADFTIYQRDFWVSYFDRPVLLERLKEILSQFIGEYGESVMFVDYQNSIVMLTTNDDWEVIAKLSSSKFLSIFQSKAYRDDLPF